MKGHKNRRELKLTVNGFSSAALPGDDNFSVSSISMFLFLFTKVAAQNLPEESPSQISKFVFSLALDFGNKILIQKNKRLLRIHGTEVVIASSINLKKKIVTRDETSGVFTGHFQLGK